MSITLLLTSAVTDPSGSVVLAQDAGILDWTGTKLNAVAALLRVGSAVAGVVIFLGAWIKSRGSFVQMLLAGLSCAVGVYFAWNLADGMQTRVDNEVNGMAPPAGVGAALVPGELSAAAGAGASPTAVTTTAGSSWTAAVHVQLT